jgi:hypothetical protein
MTSLEIQLGGPTKVVALVAGCIGIIYTLLQMALA